MMQHAVPYQRAVCSGELAVLEAGLRASLLAC